ncbi:hypothetical protein GQ43DRAFT_102398 [Delitschia confertaspora ATCC 74209]|uniref:Uncharacterized protein n=1 Tax=Delitschia confertaspora ATCC 74209 TaxID=1513339 RepID=A0A9P4JTM3_9PLEO|nr:hypothetical protein GQ43DRAFT_102398 [Delitschia confertaspora ATCC 74209]
MALFRDLRSESIKIRTYLCPVSHLLQRHHQREALKLQQKNITLYTALVAIKDSFLPPPSYIDHNPILSSLDSSVPSHLFRGRKLWARGESVINVYLFHDCLNPCTKYNLFSEGCYSLGCYFALGMQGHVKLKGGNCGLQILRVGDIETRWMRSMFRPRCVIRRLVCLMRYRRVGSEVAVGRQAGKPAREAVAFGRDSWAMFTSYQPYLYSLAPHTRIATTSIP